MLIQNLMQKKVNLQQQVGVKKGVEEKVENQFNKLHLNLELHQLLLPVI